MFLSELNLFDLSCIMFEYSAGAIFLAGNFQDRKITKRIYLKHHFIREFAEDRHGLQQGAIYKMHMDLNAADIRSTNVDVKEFKFHATELDLSMSMLRERIYGKNALLK